MTTTSKQEIERTLQNAMTVRDLIEQLQSLDPDSPVLFACNYGDYHNTQQALPVGDVEEHEASDLSTSAYSHSGLALTDELDKGLDGSYCKACDEEYDGITTCPTCGAACVGEDGKPIDANDDDDQPPVVILS